MFKPIDFEKVKVFLLEKDLQKTLDALQSRKLIEFSALKENEENNFLEKFKATERGKFASLQLTKVKKINSFFEQYKKKLSLIEKVNGFLFLEKIEAKLHSQKIENLHRISGQFLDPLYEQVLSLEERRKLMEENILKIREEIAILKILMELDIDIDLLYGYEKIEIVAGRVPKELEEALIELVKKMSKVKLIKSVGVKEKLMLFSLPKTGEQSYLKEFKNKGFERIIVPRHLGKAKEIIKYLEAKLNELNAKEKEFSAEANTLRIQSEEKLNHFQEVLEFEKNKNNSFNLFGKTEKAASFEGFVPRKGFKQFKETVLSKTRGKSLVKEIEFSNEEAPIELSNFPYIKNYEMILEMFGLPGYKRFDPTIILSLFFPVFFGIAFGDVGYGAMLLVLSIFLRFTWGRKSESIARLFNILIVGAVFTIFFGLLFGSLFGNLFGTTPGAGSIYGNEFEAIFGSKMVPLWIDPLSSKAVVFLVMVLIIGVIHVNLALIIGLIENIRKRDFKGIVFQNLNWFILEAGVVLMVLNQMMAYPDYFLWAGQGAVLLAVALLVKSSGPIGILGLSGFGGNLLSYSRLLALGLATTAIAMAINILVQLAASIPGIGPYLALSILIVGHIANFLFNLLGSFVHSVRLHFVEFFGYFFEGSGKKFDPFYFKRKFTSLKEE